MQQSTASDACSLSKNSKISDTGTSLEPLELNPQLHAFGKK
jgi:hypothetical protein